MTPLVTLVTLLSLVALALVASPFVAPPVLAAPRVQAQKVQLATQAAQNLAPLSEFKANCGIGIPCTPPLLPHGGPVQQHPVVYLIFWGSKWNTDSNLIALHQNLQDTFANLAGGAYNNILSQYYSDPNNQDSYVHNDVTIGGEWIDAQDNPTMSLVPFNLNFLSEAQRATNSQGWQPTPDSQFMVFPQAGVDTQAVTGACGEHFFSGTYIYSWVDTTGSNSQCLAQSSEVTETATHEYAEAATDPNGSDLLLASGRSWYTMDSPGRVRRPWRATRMGNWKSWRWSATPTSGTTRKPVRAAAGRAGATCKIVPSPSSRKVP